MLGRLVNAATALGITLSEAQQTALIDYVYELQKWNRTYNLTALKTIDEMLVQHVFDCLAVLPSLIHYETERAKLFKSIVDVGSGAGLPAVVLAIARPHAHVVSIDAVQKKTAFVQHVINKLGLKNLEARHARVQELSDVKADLVISRAFASLENFVDLSEGLVADAGVIAAMKSKQLESELTAFREHINRWIIHHVDELIVPELKATRYVAWLQRKRDE